ncbi:hypothetical protein LJB42_004048 [Komagataella kurtzmanii]|nr:hypothetical protein LJB42_004048 [Komagataella kurtzmanii]
MPIKYSCCREGEWLEDYNNWYDLAQLYFCTKCQRIKCWRCTQPVIKVKFCSRCSQITTGNNCPKQCFNCAKCNGALKITSSTEKDGKSFKFNCQCGYSFDTGTIHQPQPFRRIIRNLNKNTPYYQLKAFYEGKGSLPKQNEDGDPSWGTNKLPILTRVRSKNDVYCRVCKSWLIVHRADVSSTAKFNSTAQDYVPEVYLDRSQDKFLLHFINNSKELMDVKITYSPGTEYHFPNTKFKLGATTEKLVGQTKDSTAEVKTQSLNEDQENLRVQVSATPPEVSLNHVIIPIETQLQEFSIPIHVQISGQLSFGFSCMNIPEV